MLGVYNVVWYGCGHGANGKVQPTWREDRHGDGGKLDSCWGLGASSPTVLCTRHAELMQEPLVTYLVHLPEAAHVVPSHATLSLSPDSSAKLAIGKDTPTCKNTPS
jgi:hypothetical protein